MSKTTLKSFGRSPADSEMIHLRRLIPRYRGWWLGRYGYAPVAGRSSFHDWIFTAGSPLAPDAERVEAAKKLASMPTTGLSHPVQPEEFEQARKVEGRPLKDSECEALDQVADIFLALHRDELTHLPLANQARVEDDRLLLPVSEPTYGHRRHEDGVARRWRTDARPMRLRKVPVPISPWELPFVYLLRWVIPLELRRRHGRSQRFELHEVPTDEELTPPRDYRDLEEWVHAKLDAQHLLEHLPPEDIRWLEARQHLGPVEAAAELGRTAAWGWQRDSRLRRKIEALNAGETAGSTRVSGIAQKRAMQVKGENDMTEIASDERLALDALRLTELLSESAEIAERLRARFPENAAVQAAVEAFLEQAQAQAA